jgi:hypothetical protein
MTDEEELLEEIAGKCKAVRSPYVPVEYFKHVPDYKKSLKKLKRKGLIFLYKAGDAVGVSKEGLEALESLKRKKG